jgi:hypothetical protein
MVAAFTWHDSVPRAGRGSRVRRFAHRARERPGLRNTATLPPGTPLRARVAQETAFRAVLRRNIWPKIDLGLKGRPVSDVTGP